MIKSRGATTLWERWTPPSADPPSGKPATTVNNTSLNHPMYGSIAAWLVKGLAGLDVTRGGIRVRPGLAWQGAYRTTSGGTNVSRAGANAARGVVSGARVEMSTIHGRASVAWRLNATGRSLELNCSVPVGAAWGEIQIGVPRLGGEGATGQSRLVVWEGGEVVWRDGEFVGAAVPGVESAVVGVDGVSVVVRVAGGGGSYAWRASVVV